MGGRNRSLFERVNITANIHQEDCRGRPPGPKSEQLRSLRYWVFKGLMRMKSLLVGVSIQYSSLPDEPF